jgi:putative salt-induced outer membrane protein
MKTVFAIAGGCLLAAVAPAPAQEEAQKPWTSVTELGFVMTSGNSEALSLNFGEKYTRKWTKTEFGLEATAIRAESTTRSVTNTGGVLTESETTETTAELYAIGGKLRRDITPRFFWYTGGGWLRNELSGIENRFTAGAGVGYKFVDGPKHKLAGELGLSYAKEDYVFVQPDGSDSADYAAARAFLGYQYLMTDTSKITSDMEFIENLDTTDDWRIRWISAVQSSLSKRLALKVGLTLLYDNQPVLEPIDDLGTPAFDPVFFEYDELDTILTANLVLTF